MCSVDRVLPIADPGLYSAKPDFRMTSESLVPDIARPAGTATPLTTL